MALDLVLSPLISLAVQKAADSLIQQFCQMHGMKSSRGKLHRQLLAIQAVIENAEGRMKEPHVRAWLKELHAIACQAVDVLDEFQYEALRREALRQNPSSSRIHKVMKSLTLHGNSILFRREMSNKLDNVLGKINEIITEMKNFGFEPNDAKPVSSNGSPTYSCVIESDIIGRDSDKEIIMNILTDPDRAMDKISVLPIVGMGGAGKTTLAQLVYNEEKVKEHFQLQMWVCVSNNFNIVNIVKSMIEVATNGERGSTSNLEVLQKHLHEILAEKKFLLVLDDVWNEEAEKWNALKTLLFSGACSGSVIMVTTRSKNVGSIVGTLAPHDLALLSEEDSWNLFRKKAFGDGEVPQQFVEIGRTIAGKCARLPLALKVIGAMMRTKREVREWCAISEYNIWEGDTSANEVLPALKLSYDQLPSYMKHCFAFCAIFPQDCEIEKEKLIQLWMANDFIPDDGIIDLEEKGQCIFNELCSRYFFQDIREVYSYSLGTKLTRCKMHDLMHDLAKQILGNQCASKINNKRDEVLHLAIFGDQLPNNLESVLEAFPVLRTCFISNFVEESKKRKLFDSMKSAISLRALQMRCNNQLPLELGYMKHLRFLDLSRSEFDFLPETICTLYNLQTLNLSYSRVSKLPERLRCMISLRHLIFENCINLKKLPVGLRQLKCLRTLTKFMVDLESGLNIRELKTLNDLHGNLILTGLENITDRNEAEEANMDLKSKLSSLLFKWGPRNNEEAARNDQEVLEGLKPSELNYLAIHGYEGIDFPVWMKEVFVLRNVTTLILNGRINCTTLPPVWRFPLLENLELTGMGRLLYIYSTGIIRAEESEHITFPNLQKLKLCSLHNLEGWHEKDDKLVAFPKLKILKVDCCPKLKLPQISNMPMVSPSQLYISLPETHTEPDAFRPPKYVEILELHGFENVIPLEDKDDKEISCQKMSLHYLEIQRSNCFFIGGPSKKKSLGFWKYFVSIERLEIYECDALSIWPMQEFHGLKCLKELCIGGCKNFTCSPQVPSSEKEAYIDDSLPRIEKLRIAACPKLVDIPNIGSKSLVKLHLRTCQSLSKEGLKWLKNLRKLKVLHLEYCEGLKSLPDGLEFLTSLERLYIFECPGIESFPEGFEQRLPQLQIIQILSCPALERRCRSGGDYHQLVSAIPGNYI